MKNTLKFLTIAALLLAFSLAFTSCQSNDAPEEDSGESSKYENMLFPYPDEENEKAGYVNKNGEWVIEPQFDMLYFFTENGLARVEINNKYGYINEKGEWVIEPQFDYARDFAQNGLAAVRDSETGKWGYINENGEWGIESQFDYAGDFAENGLACIRVELEPYEDLYGYINEKGETVIEPQFDYARDFAQNGLAAACDSETGKWGYINENGEWAIKAQFDGAGKFYSPKAALVYIDGNDAFINEKGKVILDGITVLDNDWVDDWVDDWGMYIVKVDGKFNWVDGQGKLCIRQ